ncbi:MAG TPA: TIGR03086 family metal-binding protein [Ilumatobacteraceae bacterium]|nr:TIGR03086 family metal-binding protein [Ilumatobacteraceae bacterium]
MSTAPLEQAVAVTRGVLAAVTPDQLGAPTPCESWDVAALINHIVGAQHFFLSALSGTPPTDPPDFAAGDYLAAFDEVSSGCIEAFGADGVMERTITLPFGQMPGAAVMGLATTDTFQHGWDLAKATGQSTDLAPELASALLDQSKTAISHAFRGPEGAPFGQEQSAPDGATAADQLAAFLGRKA